MRESEKMRVTIVGAGISGLYLAYLLQKDFEVTLLEARERVGGRIFSIDGHDMGPSWIWPHHTNALKLLESLDIQIFRQYTQGLALYDTRDKLERFDASASPSFRVDGSLSSLTSRLFERLEGVQLHYAQEVREVEVKEDGVVLQMQGDSFESDFVVLTLPPRLAAKLAFTPELPRDLLQKMQNTQTWMGNSAKCVVEFRTAFWREENLSGFVFSHLGPLGEIHDACTADKAALFGFVNLNADMQNLEYNVKEQMMRLFKIEQEEILKVYVVDWKKESFSAVTEDASARAGHPHYGINSQSYSKRVLFSATEFSQEEGGYIEGALLRAQKIAKELL